MSQRLQVSPGKRTSNLCHIRHFYTDMTDSVALGEVFNQSRPARRTDKTYGKKKSVMAQSRAMHFDLFGGRQEKLVLEKMAGLTLESENPEKVTNIVVAEPIRAPEKNNKTELNPRFRGRRKVHASKKIAVRSHCGMQ